MSESTDAVNEAFWHSAAHCHRGKRRKTNQDSVLERPQSGLWVVADGMGGHLKGDHASRRICETLDGVTLNLMLSERVDQVEDLLHSVNDELRIHGRTHHQGATVGSTVVAMLADDQVGVALWAGDSRLYRLRRGQLEQVTRDHSPSFELFESGGITEEQLLATDSNVVTRAIGSQQALQLDIVVFDVVPGDMYLLCSDGLYRELTLDQLRENDGAAKLCGHRRHPAGVVFERASPGQRVGHRGPGGRPAPNAEAEANAEADTAPVSSTRRRRRYP